MHNSGFAEPAWTLPEPLAELALEDAAVIAELIETFRTDTMMRVRMVRDALTNSDLTRLRREAHTIKGSARQVGADTLGAACHELELAAIESPVSDLVAHVERVEECFDDVCVAMLLYSGQPVDSPAV